MSCPAYEIELVPATGDGGDYLLALLATVTGLPTADIAGRLPEHLRAAGRWRGQSFVEAARALGYNCNPHFKPFEARTPWPCLLRIQLPEWKSSWWCLAYANGRVYDPYGRWEVWFDDFVREHPEAHITSMLQIWIP